MTDDGQEPKAPGPARKWRRLLRRDSDRGQTLVEFALTLPVFLLLMFGLVDFGRGFYTWQVVTNAAREGARVGAVQGDNAAITARVYNSFCSSYPSNCGLDTTKVTINTANVQGARGSEITVSVSYAFQYVTPIAPLVALFGGPTLATPTISSTTKMRLE